MSTPKKILVVFLVLSAIVSAGLVVIRQLQKGVVGSLLIRDSTDRFIALEEIYDHMAAFHTEHSQWPVTLQELALEHDRVQFWLEDVWFNEITTLTYHPEAHGNPSQVLIEASDFDYPAIQRRIDKNPEYYDTLRPVLTGTGEVISLREFKQRLAGDTE